jgi:hypothetical protein
MVQSRESLILLLVPCTSAGCLIGEIKRKRMTWTENPLDPFANEIRERFNDTLTLLAGGKASIGFDQLNPVPMALVACLPAKLSHTHIDSDNQIQGQTTKRAR